MWSYTVSIDCMVLLLIIQICCLETTVWPWTHYLFPKPVLSSLGICGGFASRILCRCHNPWVLKCIVVLLCPWDSTYTDSTNHGSCIKFAIWGWLILQMRNPWIRGPTVYLFKKICLYVDPRSSNPSRVNCVPILLIYISIIYRTMLIKTHIVPGTMVSSPWSIYCGICYCFLLVVVMIVITLL